MSFHRPGSVSILLQLLEPDQGATFSVRRGRGASVSFSRETNKQSALMP